MVPVDSVEVSRASTYSGYPPETINFRVRVCHPLWTTFPSRSASQLFDNSGGGPYNPAVETTTVWAISLSLAATQEIDFSFYSYGYLDVSVLRVGHCNLCIQLQPVRESRDHHLFDGYPRLFAAFRALQSLLMPRHPPCALGSLTTRIECSQCELSRESRNRMNQSKHVVWFTFCNVFFSLLNSVRFKLNPTKLFALGERKRINDESWKHHFSSTFYQDANYHNQIVNEPSSFM